MEKSYFIGAKELEANTQIKFTLEDKIRENIKFSSNMPIVQIINYNFNKDKIGYNVTAKISK